MARTDTVGIVYLIHFDRPFRHAKHYTGWCVNLPNRMDEHASGRGGKLLRAVQAAGIGWRVVRVWPDVTRAFERRLKKRGGAARHCPLCKGESTESHFTCNGGSQSESQRES